MAGQLTERIKKMIQARTSESDSKLSEVKEWVERLKNAGFSVGDLESRAIQAEMKNERLKGLL